ASASRASTRIARILSDPLGRWGFVLFVASLAVACFGAGLEIAPAQAHMVAQGFGWNWGESVKPRDAARFAATYTGRAGRRRRAGRARSRSAPGDELRHGAERRRTAARGDAVSRADERPRLRGRACERLAGQRRRARGHTPRLRRGPGVAVPRAGSAAEGCSTSFTISSTSSW